ncbi:hypothetical protein J7J23_01850 [bacterium]|nr:hypothetical protein [bacterium]
MFRPNYEKICSIALNPLPERNREVILNRFGIGSNIKKTLQQIGNELGITRERVRQIENDSFSKIKEQKNKEPLKKTFFYFKDYFKKNGEIKREDIALNELGSNKFQGHVRFLLALGDYFYYFQKTERTHPFWSIQKDIFDEVKKIINNIVKTIEKRKSLLPEEHIAKLVRENSSLLDNSFYSILEISKDIEKSPLGQYGLVYWPEVAPKTVRDFAYLIFKKENTPLHFKEISKLFEKKYKDIIGQKNLLYRTVHNELIKDARFVLVGRGIYALKEWGYAPGTVKDVIIKVLRDSKKPLSKGEIIDNLKKQRLVKENTILLNLSNRKLFSRDKSGRYSLKS